MPGCIRKPPQWTPYQVRGRLPHVVCWKTYNPSTCKPFERLCPNAFSHSFHRGRHPRHNKSSYCSSRKRGCCDHEKGWRVRQHLRLFNNQWLDTGGSVPISIRRLYVCPNQHLGLEKMFSKQWRAYGMPTQRVS